MARSGASFVILAAVAAGIVLVMKNANATNAEGDVDMGADVSADLSMLPTDDGSDTGGYSMPDVSNFSVEQRRAAALYMLRSCEHLAASVASGDDYQTFFGGAMFSDMSDHPVITGELSPVPLSAQTCINAGYSDGVCFSTAAGAYQFTKPTWLEMRSYGGSVLPDFSRESQDIAGLRLLSKIGALPMIDAGNIAAAIPVMGKRWASLPGAVGKQGQRSVQFALAKFGEGLQA